MKKIIQRALLLLLIFLAAIVVYFVGARKNVAPKEAVYGAMGEPTLPVVYTVCQGREINGLHGYLQDMGNEAAKEVISVLPPERQMELHIADYGNTIAGIRYEIRTLEMDHLIEKTEVEGWDTADGMTRVVLPIQNLISKDQEYFMSLTLDTPEGEINYYTRILWTDHNNAADMVRLAEDFTTKSLDYNQARELSSYLEPDQTEENNSLGHVTIHASFDHLTWDGLPVQMEGTPRITLQEFDGIMGQIQVTYQVRISEEGKDSILVDAEDNFTMKWSDQRIYLMNYDRYADEVFTGGESAYSGKRIMLGISSGGDLETMKSASGGYLAFTVRNGLWCYDQSGAELLSLFSFDSETDDGVRSGYDHHGIKLLAVQDDGSVDFLVYGYMNRGTYEGQAGVVYYRYVKESDTVQEKFFIPCAESYEMIRSDVEQLSYLSPDGMMYLMLKGNVYGIDLESSESMSVVRGLSEGSYAVSQDGSRLAWEEKGESGLPETLHVMDFNTAQKQEISGEGGYVKALGFVGSDLIYGLGGPEDMWRVNGRIKELPVYVIYIVDSSMKVQSEYQREGMFLSDVRTEEDRIHLNRLVKTGDGQYAYQDNDTIVCNQKIDNNTFLDIGWMTSQTKGRVCFVQVSSELKPSSITVKTPNAFSYENTSTLRLGTEGGQAEDSLIFYAYGGGHYVGCARSFTSAVNMVYDKMGYVTDGNHRIVWDRVNRRNAAGSRDPETAAAGIVRHLGQFSESTVYEDGMLLIDAAGCSLNQVLYFVDKGIPVLAYLQEGQYLLITGYDSYNVTLYRPESGESWKMGLGDAAAYFESLQNDFICGLSME